MFENRALNQKNNSAELIRFKFSPFRLLPFFGKNFLTAVNY